MANEMCNKLAKKVGMRKKRCDKGCEYFKFPHLKNACVLSVVYSVNKGDGCYIYKAKKD